MWADAWCSSADTRHGVTICGPWKKPTVCWAKLTSPTCTAANPWGNSEALCSQPLLIPYITTVNRVCVTDTQTGVIIFSFSIPKCEGTGSKRQNSRQGFRAARGEFAHKGLHWAEQQWNYYRFFLCCNLSPKFLCFLRELCNLCFLDLPNSITTLPSGWNTTDLGEKHPKEWRALFGFCHAENAKHLEFLEHLELLGVMGPVRGAPWAVAL